ncbi:DNA-binding protein [Agromyces sp. C10]|uniref:DNA-binding protein n=1 Tax=Agromyces sp. C10 TaxID=2935077 RepID=UPI00200AFAEF|nr:DNA-binding protein [Agromyces sp. C10]MCK8610338.1 DNA-binding protein [Agromyces sp. C10]
MFVITADQIGSRADIDRSAAMQEELQAEYGDRLALPVDQTAGDEVQAITADPGTALELVLALHRAERWSIGLGVGDVREPLPDAVRKAAGPAFIAAREAVDAAKRADARFALRAADDRPGTLDAAQVEALVRLLLLLRDRRTPQGWEAVDLVRDGRTQKDAARLLGISDAAVSQRLRAAQWNADGDALPALVRLLAELDRRGAGADGDGDGDGDAPLAEARHDGPAR